MSRAEPGKSWLSVFSAMRKEFDPPLKAGPFRIWSGETRPAHGKGHGSHGLRHRRIAEHYGDWLVAAHAHFTSYGRRCREPIDVVVCDLEAYRPGVQGVVFPLEHGLGMLLPSQIRHASQPDELEIMKATASHECVHLFNFYERPHGDLDNKPWRWFDEATATYFEYRLASRSQDWYRFGAAHQFHPECPAYFFGGNHGCALVHRLVEEFQGEEVLHRVWMESAGSMSSSSSTSKKHESALEAIAAQFRRHPRDFVSSDPEQKDFYSDFCISAYYSGASGGQDLLHHLGLRYGQRALRQSWQLNAASGGGCDQELLPGLGCYHYRIYLDRSHATANFRVQQVAGPPRSLKAIVSRAANGAPDALNPTEHELGWRTPLTFAEDEQLLTGKVPLSDPEGSHLVLTVINTDYACTPRSAGFKLRVDAEAR